MPKQDKECKRKEVLIVVDTVREEKLDELKLLISGFVAGVEASQVKESA